MGEQATPRIGCIGAGYWGRNLIRNFHALDALEAICDPDPARVEEFSKAYPETMVGESVAAVLSNSKIVGIVIASPAETHAPLVRDALSAGKHVFVEKPLCLSVREAKDLISLAAEKQRLLMVGHLLWYHPAVLKLQQLVKDGQLGRIRYIYSNRLNLGRFRREENILWSFAPHDISVILGLVGEMPDCVDAQGCNYLHDRIADVTVSLLSFPSGTKAHIFVSWLHPYKEQKLIVVGERGMAVFDDLSEHKLSLYPHIISWNGSIPVPNKAAAVPISIGDEEPLRAECRHFLECIVTDQRPRTDGHEGLRVLTVLQQCQDALHGARTIVRTTSKIELQKTHFVHETAVIDDQTEVGEGTTIWHFSHVLSGSRIGKQCRIGQNVVIGPNVTVGNGVKIQNNVSVYEGVTLEDDVFCGPSVVFTNVYNPRSEVRRMDELRPTVVRRGATLGANCTIVCGVTIGHYAFVGAGAVVTRDVPDFALVVGNPARVVGWMCACGHRIQVSEDGNGICGACRRQYERIGKEVRAA